MKEIEKSVHRLEMEMRDLKVQQKLDKGDVFGAIMEQAKPTPTMQKILDKWNLSLH